MAVKLALTDGAAEWLKERLGQLKSDWRWLLNDPHKAPTLDDKLFLREIMRELDK